MSVNINISNDIVEINEVNEVVQIVITSGTGTVQSVNLTAGTGISVSGGPITTSGNINVVNTAPDQVVVLTGAGTTTISGTYPNFTITSADSTLGTVTSVNMTVPTGLTISGNPITSAGTLAIALASGFSIPTTASQATWDSAYNDKINSAAVTGTATKTLTLNQQDGGTVTATWSDTGLTSVGLSMPSAFSVSNSPLTSNGTIAVSGGGTALQYIDGLGALATFPLGLPPTGTAGGDLTGTYPNPTVHRVHGEDFQSGVPTANDVWVYGGPPNKWQHQQLNTNQLVNGANFITLGSLSATAPLVYSSGAFSITQATTSVNGFLSAADFTTFNNKQATLSLTTTGTSGASTFSANTINIPNYTLAGLGGLPLTGGTLTGSLGGTTATFSSDILINSVNVGRGGGNISTNTRIGNSALFSNTIGVDNSAMGVNALYNNTTGSSNSAIGVTALFSNTTGVSNSAIGRTALFSNTTGVSNSAMGVNALFSNTTGNENSAMGVAALSNNTTGSNNTAMGVNALFSNTTGISNSAMGLSALFNNTTGSNNTVVGFNTALGITTGSNNTIIGANVTGLSATLTNNIIIADGSGNQRLRFIATGESTFSSSVTATSFIKSGGTSSQFLKADGSVDSSVYYLASNPSGFTTNVGTVTSVGLSSATSGVTIGSSPITTSGTITLAIATASGSQNGLLSSADFTTFNSKQVAGNYITALTGEVTASGPGSVAATLLNSAVIGKVLTGLNLSGGGTIVNTDTILQAFGKTQNQISALVGGVMYDGVWNATTNTPAIVSSVGSKGDYYVVNVAGSTNIDGITDWKVGDWIIFNGTTWDKVDNTDAVSSVNSFVGAVSLTTANISEVTNLYYLDSRARTAISLTTTGTSGAATYNNSTGVFNIPNYANVVTSVFGRTGAVVATNGDYNTSQVTENVANLYYTEARVNANTNVSANTAARHNALTISTANGLSLSVQALSLALATTSVTGALSSTDFTTFNNKQGTISLTTSGTSGAATFSANTLNIPQYQAVLTNPVTGSGNNNFISKFTSTGSTIGNSAIQDDGTDVTITGRVLKTGAIFSSAIGGAGNQEALRIYNDNGYIGFFNTANSTRSAYIQGNTTDLTLNTSLAIPILFGTSNVTKMTFNASGNLSIGNTNDSFKLDVSGTGRFNNTLRIEKSIDYGIYGADGFNINVVNTSIATSKSGNIAFTGFSGNGTSPYQWGYIAGEKDSATGDGAYAGSLTFWTTSGGAGGEVNSAIYKRLTISGTGAATFSSSGNIISLVGATSNSSYLKFAENGVADRWCVGVNASDTSLYFRPSSNTTSPVLTIASTGAATFSSTIRSNATNGLGIGSISGYRRIQYDNASEKFSLIRDDNGLANFEANLAIFTNLVTSNQGFRTNALNGYILRDNANSVNLGGLTRRSFWAGGTSLDTQIFAETGYSIFINPGGSSSIGLTLASTGAATFSSSVTATGLFLSTTNDLIGVINSSNANGGYLTWQTSGSTIADIGTSQQIFGSGGNNTFGINAREARSLVFGTNNTLRLTIASTGAATFSSSVTASSFIPNGSSVPTLGMYSSAANTLDFATNTTNRFSISSAGAATFTGNLTTGDQILIGTAATVNGAINFIKTNGTPVASRITFGTDGTGYKFAIAKNVSSTITDLFTIQDNGAATFSSTLGINGVADNIKSGTYTPTLTNTFNVTSTTFISASFQRIGSTVTVFVKFNMTAPSSSLPSTVSISIPVGGNFTAGSQANGLCVVGNATSGGGRINATTGGVTTVECEVSHGTTSSVEINASFQYQVQ